MIIFLTIVMINNKLESPFYKELEDFIKKEIGFRINEDTLFFKDLKLIGDDADSFMLRFSDIFGVDMKGFKLDDYFIDEYIIPFQFLFDRWFRKEKIKRKEFNVKHLLKVIEEKKWIDI